MGDPPRQPCIVAGKESCYPIAVQPYSAVAAGDKVVRYDLAAAGEEEDKGVDDDGSPFFHQVGGERCMAAFRFMEEPEIAEK